MPRIRKTREAFAQQDYTTGCIKKYLKSASGELLPTMLAVGAAAGTCVPKVILHQDPRYHGSALRGAEHCVVLACVKMRLEKKY